MWIVAQPKLVDRVFRLKTLESALTRFYEKKDDVNLEAIDATATTQKEAAQQGDIMLLP